MSTEQERSRAIGARNEQSGRRREHVTGSEVRTAFIRGETFEPRPVQYSVVDGRAIFEGDIILGLDEDLQSQTRELRENAARRPQAWEVKRARVTSSILLSQSPASPWP